MCAPSPLVPGMPRMSMRKCAKLHRRGWCDGARPACARPPRAQHDRLRGIDYQHLFASTYRCWWLILRAGTGIYGCGGWAGSACRERCGGLPGGRLRDVFSYRENGRRLTVGPTVSPAVSCPLHPFYARDLCPMSGEVSRNVRPPAETVRARVPPDAISAINHQNHIKRTKR
jgi:hypothetical protein